MTQLQIIAARMDRATLTFSLTGRSAALDPKTDAVRPDLADIALADRLFAPHFASAAPYRCIVPFAAIFAGPDGEQSSEVLHGEGFSVLDLASGWAWGWSNHDHYVGYIRADHILPGTPDKSSKPADASPLDFARNLIGMSYLWGGRGGAGIDCSGLVQRAFAAAGLFVPRDSDQQRVHLGYAIEPAAAEPGDLLFFPGHVGLLAESQTLIHATSHHGGVVEEPLSRVVERFTAEFGCGIVEAKRVDLST